MTASLENVKKMTKNPQNIKLYILLLLPAAVLCSYLAQFYPAWIEKYFAQGLFVIVNPILSCATGLLPFSLAEVSLVLLAFTIIISLYRLVTKLIRHPAQRKSLLANFLLNIAVISSLFYFSFNLLWGLNYYRQPFAVIASLEVMPATVTELEELCHSLIEQANSLREKTAEDQQGVMRLHEGRTAAFQTAKQGFTKAKHLYPQLGGSYGQPKGVILSPVMSYAGITGIYFPFTGEANVNALTPASSLPATICHEMAHQRGFAREDEANYLAYLTCILHPNPDFQYSGTLLALTNSINALYRYAPEQALLLQEDYSAGVARDLLHRKLFWQQYEGPLEEISREINDSYLKANRQEDGVHSYGRMVDLLLASYRQQQQRR